MKIALERCVAICDNCSVTVIKRKTLLGYAGHFPDAKESLEAWFKKINASTYNTIIELRRDFPSADAVADKMLICFNIKGNHYRLIVRITWGKTVFIHEFLTHAEYSKKY